MLFFWKASNADKLGNGCKTAVYAMHVSNPNNIWFIHWSILVFCQQLFIFIRRNGSLSTTNVALLVVIRFSIS